MNERFVRELAAFFTHHLSIPHPSEVAIRTALQTPFLGHVIEYLMPEWILVQDMECIEDDADYAELVRACAAITQGA